MAGDRVIRYPVQKSLSALGVNVRAPAISMDPTLHKDSLNMSTGLRDGIGPRMGMAPIPNHNDQVQFAVGDSYYYGLAASEEGTLATSLIYTVERRKVFGVFPLQTFVYTDNSAPSQVRAYAWLITGKYDSSNDYVDLVHSIGRSTNYPAAELASGISKTAATVIAASQTLERMFFVSSTAANWDDAVRERFKIATSKAYAAAAQIVVGGRDIPAEWLWGSTTGAGSATVPSTSNYATNDGTRATGVHTPWVSRVFKDSFRTINIFDIDDANGLQYQFVYNSFATASSTIYPAYIYSGAAAIATASLPAASSISTRIDAAASAAASVDRQLLNDPDLTINSGYTMFLAAASSNPIAFIHKTWAWPEQTRVLMPVDLTSIALYPNTRPTTREGGGGVYLEDGSPRQTCFKYWPNFTSGTALPTELAAARSGTIHVTLGAAGSGILRADTTYEFTFSIFNKMTGYESNVGEPARFMTGSDEFVALSIYRDPTSTSASGGTLRQRAPFNVTEFPFDSVVNGDAYPLLNYMEHRFYYRELGEYEWKPALFIDTAKLFFYPNHNVLWACEGAIAGLPGGQVGGFNDYSPLPQGKYIDVVVFQERAFWCTENSVAWSYRRNPFAYAGRNSSSAPSGLLKGLKVHVYAGQRENANSSRLLIFGTEAIYSGRFTGEFILQPVQVSPDEIHDFPQEGSDFLIDFWTSFTAFSSRAAVIADGQLFYWGPNGVFWDDGGGEPSRISPKLEPDLFSTVVDQTRTDEVFGIYCEATREIFWFYPLIDGSTTTTGVLSFNLETREFMFGEIAGKVDAGQNVTIEKESVNWKSIAGKRVLLFARQDSSKKIQRGYYFDERNRGGDMMPFEDMQIRSVATLGTATQWRLTLAQGTYDATTLAAIAANDYLAGLQFAAYTRSYSSGVTEDFIAKVLAVGATYIDVALPTGMDFSGAITFPRGQLAPLWHRGASAAGVNGFSWRLETNYWAPAGVDLEAFWKYLHMLFKVTLVESRLNVGYTLGVQTPQRASPYSVALRLRDNFDGHDQTYAPIHFSDAAVQSQALKVILSGFHIGSEWVLQYLAAHGTPTGEIDFLKQFEPQKA